MSSRVEEEALYPKSVSVHTDTSRKTLHWINNYGDVVEQITTKGSLHSLFFYLFWFSVKCEIEMTVHIFFYNVK